MCKQATASTYTVFNHVITRLKKTGLCANKPLRPHTLCAFKPLRPHSVCSFKPLRPHALCANKAYQTTKHISAFSLLHVFLLFFGIRFNLEFFSFEFVPLLD